MGQGITVNQDEKLYSGLVHVLALSGLLIPLANIIVPLVLWMMKKSVLPQVDSHGKESLNFQISMMIYLLIAIILTPLVIGYFLIPVLVLLDVVFTVIATVRAYDGEEYRYPLSMRFIN